MGIAPLKGHESIFNTFSKGPFRPGREGERVNGKRKRRTSIPPPSLRSSSSLSQGDKGNGKRKAGGVFMNEGKQGGKNKMPRNEILPSISLSLPSRAHEHVVRENEGESPGRTRASHPGEQERVTRENEGESPGRTRASHPGERGRVTQEDYSGYHERRFWAPKEAIRGLVQDHPLMLVGQ